MNPSYDDAANSAQGRARVPGSGGGYDPDLPTVRPSGDGTGGVTGRAPVGRASVGTGPVGSAAVGNASVGRAAVSGRATVGERPDLLPGHGGPGAPGGPGGPGAPGGPGGPGGPARGRKGARSRKTRRRNIILAVIAVFIMLSGGAGVAGGYYFDSVQLTSDVPLPEATLIT